MDEQKGENVIGTKYEVIRFIEHGGRCRPSMDWVEGELLIHRVKDCPNMEKAQLFDWFHQLYHQILQYHKCHNEQNYRYVNPYSVLVAQDGKLLLLDIEAESNEFVLRNLQKRAMRNHFVKPIVHIRERSGDALDLYGYGKTIQFILANTKIEPSLTKSQENKLEKIIDRCLNENSKKQYQELKQIERELPIIREKELWKEKKTQILKIFSGAAACVVVCNLLFTYNLLQAQKELQIRIRGLEHLQQENDDELNVKVTEDLIASARSDLEGKIGEVEKNVEEVRGLLEQHKSEMQKKEEQELEEAKKQAQELEEVKKQEQELENAKKQVQKDEQTAENADTAESTDTAENITDSE